MTTSTASLAPSSYVDPFPGRKGSDRIVEPCGKCSGTGVYSGKSGWTFYTAAVESVTAGCFDCRGTGTYSFLVSSARASARKAAKSLDAMRAEALVSEAAREAFQAAHPDLLERLAAAAPKDRFLSDLHDDVLSGDVLTEEQVAAVEEGLLAVAAREAAKVPVVEGRYEVVGRILTQKSVETAYGYSLKMLVAVDGGYKVWGSVPSALDAETGDRVAFTGTVEASRDDPAFGFFKRPTKARKL